MSKKETLNISESLLGSNTIFLGDREILFPLVKQKALEMYEGAIFYEIEKLNISVYDIRVAIGFSNKTSDSKKVVMLSSFYWQEEAQNALLKVLEETPDNTIFYIFGLSERNFLETILSRTRKINFKGVNRYTELARNVLALAPTERLENKEVKKVLALKIVDFNFQKNLENEKKDREAHVLLLFSLMDTLLENKERLGLDKNFLEKLLKISTLAETEGASPHLFIEWLLLSSPKIE